MQVSSSQLSWPNELKFGGMQEHTWGYLSANFHPFWSTLSHWCCPLSVVAPLSQKCAKFGQEPIEVKKIPNQTKIGVDLDTCQKTLSKLHFQIFWSGNPAKNGLEKWKIEAFVTKNLASGSQKFFHYWLQHTETIQMRCRNPLEPNIEAKSRLQKGVEGEMSGWKKTRHTWDNLAIKMVMQ